MDGCNATEKFGSRIAICDLPFGHPDLHRSTLGGITQEWRDDWPTQVADALVNPN